MPSDGDFGPYHLLPHNRIAITSEDLRNHSRDIYSYHVEGKKLILHAISETDPSVTRAALRLDSVHLYFFSAAALLKVR
jgi:hypothetical protein